MRGPMRAPTRHLQAPTSHFGAATPSNVDHPLSTKTLEAPRWVCLSLHSGALKPSKIEMMQLITLLALRVAATRGGQAAGQPARPVHQ